MSCSAGTTGTTGKAGTGGAALCCAGLASRDGFGSGASQGGGACDVSGSGGASFEGSGEAGSPPLLPSSERMRAITEPRGLPASLISPASPKGLGGSQALTAVF